jgi:hypothetical protein
MLDFRFSKSTARPYQDLMCAASMICLVTVLTFTAETDFS